MTDQNDTTTDLSDRIAKAQTTDPVRPGDDVIERAARTIYEGFFATQPLRYVPWDQAEESVKDNNRLRACALADAGLLEGFAAEREARKDAEIGSAVTAARSRSRASAKKAGASFERLIADYLRDQVGDDRIDRRVRNGAKDRGDISGVHARGGGRVVVECKNVTRWSPAEWLAEAEIEAGNDDALLGVVVAKRRGITDPGQQLVMCTVDDLIALITGSRPTEEEPAA